MPYLSIIPAAAVADEQLSDTQVRVLCAIGTFTSRLGGEMWASVGTLAKACHLSERSVQRALPVLLERGYLRRKERPGRSNIYEVVLQGVTPQSPRGDTPVTPPPTGESPERFQENGSTNERGKRRVIHPQAREVVLDLLRIYPKRDTTHPFTPALAVISTLLASGADPADLRRAAEGYARYVERERTDPKFRKGLARFYSDGVWEQFLERTVHGLTRAEWVRTGQDVTIWDRLVGGEA